MGERLTPILGAVMIGWIFSVCVHEYAHALVAYWGGDDSVRERGYLSFNPLAYIDPVYTILLPCLFLLMGGIPLPGAAVRINVGALRGKHWRMLVSAAGPAANLLMFVVLGLVIHPSWGLVDAQTANPPAWAVFLGALTVLQAFAFLLNLIPVPPLDGFGMLEPYLPLATRIKLADPRFTMVGLLIVFFGIFDIPALRDGFFHLIDVMLDFMGLPYETTWRFYNLALFGKE